MAWITPAHSCGHESRVQTLAPVSQRYDIELKLSDRPCKACRQAQTQNPAVTHDHPHASAWCRRCGGPVADGSGLCGEC